MTPLTLQAIRRANFKKLVSTFDTKKAFAEATGLQGPHISMITKERREVGEGAARRIEQRLALPHEWMDQPSAEVPVDLMRSQLPSARNKIVEDLIDSIIGTRKSVVVAAEALVQGPYGHCIVSIGTDAGVIDVRKVTEANFDIEIDRMLARKLRVDGKHYGVVALCDPRTAYGRAFQGTLERAKAAGIINAWLVVPGNSISVTARQAFCADLFK